MYFSICMFVYMHISISSESARIQFKTLCLFDSFDTVLSELPNSGYCLFLFFFLFYFFCLTDQNLFKFNKCLFSFIYMHVLSLCSRLILFPCHKVLFSLMPFVSSLKVFPLCHLASFQGADNEMQFSGLLSTDSPDCCRRS